MKTFSDRDSIYIGREAGREILSIIKGAKKSVKVVSPYLSPDYVKELIKLHKESVKITLITCDKIGEGMYSDFRASDLVKRKKIHDDKAGRLKKQLWASSRWLFIASLVLGVPAFAFPMLLFFAGIFLAISAILFGFSSVIESDSYECSPIFRIKVFDSTSGENPRSTELIHSKIFVIDEKVAFLGSVNFTYSGFKKHYETAIKVEGLNAIRDISEEVERLYNSKDLREKDVEEWS